MGTRIMKFLALLAVAAPLAANAVPVRYDMTFAATTGPSGTGSFFFDSTIGAITGFSWDFGGVTGGIADGQYGTVDVFGDTRGRFVFEMLSQTDAHSAVDCLHGGCGTGDPITVGSGPLGTTSFSLNSTNGGPATYIFSGTNGFDQGSVILARAVSEPSTLALLAIAMMGVGFIGWRRRTVA
jgi:hypothetical protein